MRKIHIDRTIVKRMYVYRRYSQDEIGKRFNCSQWVISNRLRQFNIKTRPKTCNLVNRKYTYNRNFLKNITPNIAWVLGLLVSDGFVRRDGFSAHFGLKLKRKDEDVIFKIKRILEYQGPLFRGVTKLEHKGSIKKFSYTLLQISDVNAVRGLEQIGVKQNKTRNENFLACIKETNNEDIISSFIRGIYDGDGSLLFDKKRNSICFQIVDTYELLEEIQNYLIHYRHLNKTKLTQNILGKNHFALRYRGNIQATKILNWLYKHTSPFNRMDRKFNNFCKIRRTICK